MANVVISGANRGIGFALTARYVANGDHVFAGCRDPDDATQLAALSRASEGRVTILKLDVVDPAAIEALGRAITEPVDILINNAGMNPAGQTLDDIDYEGWIQSFQVNTLAPFRLVRSLLDQLSRAGSAKIMTISTTGASSTWVGGGYYAYCSAKAASNRVMQLLAVDLRDRGISVGSIHPGHVKTKMGGEGAILTPEESAAGICAVLAKLNLVNSGRFWNWTGDEHPL